MLPLLVRITNTKTNETNSQAFASSPVRIGRNQLNELVLNKPFVSQWHAVVRFDEQNVRFVDLGSTNGTVVNGQRLQRHVQVPIDPQTDLRIGPLKLSFARAHVTPDMFAAPRTTIFSIELHGDPAAQAVSNSTMAFDMEQPAAGPKTMFMRSPLLEEGAKAGAAKPQPPQHTARLNQLIQQLDPYHNAYRQSWSSTLQAIQHHFAQVPVDQREPIALGLCQRYPQLKKEPEFRTYMQSLGISMATLGEVDAEEWLLRLTTEMGGTQVPKGEQLNIALAMERVGSILESFSQAYVELRRGQEQFGEEMALRLIQEPTPLHEAQNSSEVLRYLLDWNTTGREQISALTRAFADLALHQVAMLSGVIEGARSLMSSLSPTTISGAQSTAIARSGGSGLFQRLFPFRRASLWQSFTDRHTQLMEEDRFTREIFGGHFARAYFTVTGGHMDHSHHGHGGHAGHGASGQHQAQGLSPQQQQQYGAYATRPPQ